MKSLAVIALLEQTKNITSLGELVQFCSSSEDIANISRNSLDFWKESLGRIFTWDKDIANSRGDLETAEDWYNYIQFLSRGVSFKYIIARRDHEEWDPEVNLYYRDFNDVRFHSFGGLVDKKTFTIPGSSPIPGTRGLFASFKVGYSFYPKETKVCFLGSDLKIVRDKINNWLSEGLRRWFLYEVFNRGRFFGVIGPAITLRNGKLQEIIQKAYHQLNILRVSSLQPTQKKMNGVSISRMIPMTQILQYIVSPSPFFLSYSPSIVIRIYKDTN